MTGREKMAIMTTKEMAKTIVSSCECCVFQNDGQACADVACWEGIKLWLEQEVPE